MLEKMIRFSQRLKRKRETRNGKEELILPQAPVVGGTFPVNISCFLSDSYNFLAEIEVQVRSTDFVSWLRTRLLEAWKIDEKNKRELEVEFRYRNSWLGDDDILANCNVKQRSNITAFVQPSARLGVAFYKQGDYEQAFAHLCSGLAGAACGRVEYAAYYADILLHNRADLQGYGTSRLRYLEAAEWILVAASETYSYAYAWLWSLSPEFARKFETTRDKSTLRGELCNLFLVSEKYKTFLP